MRTGFHNCRISDAGVVPTSLSNLRDPPTDSAGKRLKMMWCCCMQAGWLQKKNLPLLVKAWQQLHSSARFQFNRYASSWWATDYPRALLNNDTVSPGWLGGSALNGGLCQR
jgi:hypothetical protein